MPDLIVVPQFPSKHPPAEPEAFRLLAPQRGLIAIAQNKSPRPKLNSCAERLAADGNRSLTGGRY